MDTVLVYTILLYARAIIRISLFGWFILKLIKQHYCIYPLFYYREEAEKKRHGDD